jgi:hypothetical protein
MPQQGHRESGDGVPAHPFQSCPNSRRSQQDRDSPAVDRNPCQNHEQNRIYRQVRGQGKPTEIQRRMSEPNAFENGQPVQETGQRHRGVRPAAGQAVAADENQPADGRDPGQRPATQGRKGSPQQQTAEQ